MKTMPRIGSRVIYRRQPGEYIPARECQGTVIGHYPGGQKMSDPETGEEWIVPDHVSVRVDSQLPHWWPYGGTDRFAPDLAEVEFL